MGLASLYFSMFESSSYEIWCGSSCCTLEAWRFESGGKDAEIGESSVLSHGPCTVASSYVRIRLKGCRD